MRFTDPVSYFAAMFALMVIAGSRPAEGQSTPQDHVFRDREHQITFRYPSNWSQREAQLALVLLYADDGSLATCNVGVSVQPLMKGLSPSQIQQLRETNHTRSYFEKSGSKMRGYRILNYRRGVWGQEDAGIVEAQHTVYIGDAPMVVTMFQTATFANERRYVLTCNGPANGIATAKTGFDYIRGTTIFLP